MNRDDILTQAEHYINHDRAATHGDAEDNFQTIAEGWNWFLSNRPLPDDPLTSADVAVMLALFKVARIVGNPAHDDSWVDAVGYLAIGGEISLQK
jgi:hypothetical protein